MVNKKGPSENDQPVTIDLQGVFSTSHRINITWARVNQN